MPNFNSLLTTINNCSIVPHQSIRFFSFFFFFELEDLKMERAQNLIFLLGIKTFWQQNKLYTTFRLFCFFSLLWVLELLMCEWRESDCRGRRENIRCCHPVAKRGFPREIAGAIVNKSSHSLFSNKHNSTASISPSWPPQQCLPLRCCPLSLSSFRNYGSKMKKLLDDELSNGCN